MKTFTLEAKKQLSVTEKQFAYFSSLAEKTCSSVPNKSQVMKYCSKETMSEAIEEMKTGNKISF